MDAKTAKLDLGSVHSDLMQAGQGAAAGRVRTGQGRAEVRVRGCAYLMAGMVGTNPSALTLDY